MYRTAAEMPVEPIEGEAPVQPKRKKPTMPGFPFFSIAIAVLTIEAVVFFHHRDLSMLVGLFGGNIVALSSFSALVTINRRGAIMAEQKDEEKKHTQLLLQTMRYLMREKGSSFSLKKYIKEHNEEVSSKDAEEAQKFLNVKTHTP